MPSAFKFLTTVKGSIQGYINSQELNRAILTALGSGSLLGIIILVLQSVLAHTSEIFPNPTISSLATMFLTLVLDLVRRQNQGELAKPSSK
ncbi:hypothetical protein P12x_003572 [Tundrisphaera lichenicola]|uniref:hypothetical protein n=1 Tax=Tundrisphaera lichenicola TaxID=2029860 RepID=UPI003EB9DAE2